MSAPPTYTLVELEQQSGFDKRTISYYISEGLLPKIGRRGPKTTYPQEFLDRLMFIRRCRDLQDRGRLRAVTLKEISQVMYALGPEDFRQASRGLLPEERVRELFLAPDWDTTAYAIPAEVVAADERGQLGAAVKQMDVDPALSRTRMESSRSRSRRERMQQRMAVAGDSPAKSRLALPEYSLRETHHFDELRRKLEQLGGLFREVQDRARMAAKLNKNAKRETLVRVQITDDILLSVRNIGEDHAQLVEELAELIRHLGDL